MKTANELHAMNELTNNILNVIEIAEIFEGEKISIKSTIEEVNEFGGYAIQKVHENNKDFYTLYWGGDEVVRVRSRTPRTHSLTAKIFEAHIRGWALNKKPTPLGGWTLSIPEKSMVTSVSQKYRWVRPKPNRTEWVSSDSLIIIRR